MKKHEISIRDELTEFLLYTTPDAGVRVEVFFHDETIWLPQKRLAELFSVNVATINEHLKNIYASGELTEAATIRKSLIVQIEGEREVRRDVQFYNLDAILSVNRFLEFNEYRILEGKGSISHQAAKERAAAEYDQFNQTQNIESDFDRFVKQLEAKSGEGTD